MPAPYSGDLRDRVAAALAEGASARPAARRFGISVSTAIRWAQRLRLKVRRGRWEAITARVCWSTAQRYWSWLPSNRTTAVIENGFVHIPETAPWLAEYLHELTVFPNGKHDDQADSTAQFFDWFKRPFPGQGLYELMRIQAERARNRENLERRFHPRDGQPGLDRWRVRLRAPPSLGAVQTFSGQHIIVGLDGTIEMSAADAQFYIRDGWAKLAEWTIG